jgi:nucleoside phosphorylase
MMRVIVLLALITFSCGGLNHSVRSHGNVHEDLDRIQREFEECQINSAKKQAQIDSLEILIYQEKINQIKQKRKKDF